MKKLSTLILTIIAFHLNGQFSIGLSIDNDNNSMLLNLTNTSGSDFNYDQVSTISGIIDESVPGNIIAVGSSDFNVSWTGTGYTATVTDVPSSSIANGETIVLAEFILQDSDYSESDFSIRLTTFPPQIATIRFDDTDYYPIIESTTLLPINLKSFSADKHSETSAVLNWESLSEINASHYIVERSIDTEQWTALGKVATIGSETAGATYAYVDSDLPLHSRNVEQIFYYRLRMVDLDGSYEFSHTEAVRFDKILLEGLHILPNPTAQDIYVSIDKVKEGTELLLLDNAGKVVLKHSLTDGRDERVSLRTLSGGTYFAKVVRDNETLTKKLVKIE